MFKFNKGETVLINTGGVNRIGFVTMARLANIHENDRNSEMAVVAVYHVEHETSRTRFYQRRSGHIFHSQRWELKKVENT